MEYIKKGVISMPGKQDDKNWSFDDVDRLLSRTEKPAKKQDGVVENFARTMRLADAVTPPASGAEEKLRVESIQPEGTRRFEVIKDTENQAPSSKTGDIEISSKTAKQRISEIIKGMKSTKSPSFKANGSFDEPLLPKKDNYMEMDENRRKFLEVVQLADEKDEADTSIIERPGFIVKKHTGQATGGLEGVPTLIDAEDAKNEFSSFHLLDLDEEQDEHHIEQIRLNGFDGEEEAPEKINEVEAEKSLLQKRKERIDTFKLMGIAEAEDEEKTSDTRLEHLFGEHQKRKKKTQAQNYFGAEYTDEKDAQRLKESLNATKRNSALKLGFFSFAAAVMLVMNIISCITTKADSSAFQLANFVLLLTCSFIGFSCINQGMLAVFQREPNLKSAVALTVMAALIQNITVLIAGTILDYSSFVFSAGAAVAFAINEYGEYLRHARTYDALDFCTGENKDKLFSIQEIENKNDAFEIGRTLLMDSPDIRYSCKAKMPSKLIGSCQADVSSDKLMNLLLPLAFAGSVICAIIAGAITKDILFAVSCAASAICVCTPIFGMAAIQLPLRWANKRLNKAGGLITGQRAVEDYSKTNAIVIDSAELFDQKACCLHGFKNFGTVRVDDMLLYASAMMIKAEGPLTEVFSQVVSKKDLLPQVRSFKYEDRMGLSGWINDQRVIMGDRNMMKHHNFEPLTLEQEQSYSHDKRKVIYIAIANKLAAILVVSYAPNKKLIPFIRRLGTDGVTILLRNNDSNITTETINESFGVKFNNIKLINNTSGRIYKKYRHRIRESAKSGIIHDGNAFSFMRSFTMSYTLCGTFKVENLLQLINVIAGFVIVAVLSALKVLQITGAWPLVVFQLLMMAISFLIARFRGIF